MKAHQIATETRTTAAQGIRRLFSLLALRFCSPWASRVEVASGCCVRLGLDHSGRVPFLKFDQERDFWAVFLRWSSVAPAADMRTAGGGRHGRGRTCSGVSSAPRPCFLPGYLCRWLLVLLVKRARRSLNNVQSV